MADDKSPMRAYGQTHADVEEIRLNQIQGTVKMMVANNLNTINDEWFEKDYNGENKYMIPVHDKMHYHVAMEMREFNVVTGERKSKSFVNVMDTATFNQMKNAKPHDGFFGKNVAILHDPTKGMIASSERFKTLKEAKEFYETLSGNPAGKFWTMKTTLEEIELHEKQLRDAERDRAKGTLKFGDPDYVLQPGDPGYIDPAPQTASE